MSTLQAALRARRRQYEVRDLHASLEQRVQERTEQVQNLVTQLTMSEQAERRRISAILHDDLQQRLFSIKFQLATVRYALANEELESGRLTLAEIEDAVDNAVSITRNLSVDLSPPVLHEEGIVEALGWLAMQMERQHGLVVNLQVRETLAGLDEDLRVLLYHAVRELLFNIVKHAGVTAALVRVTQEDGQLLIEICDQGRGFNVDVIANSDGQGLPRMAHRLQLVGGHMQINSIVGKGTHVTLAAPWRSRKSD
jgi:signal transduction histidine kinase